MKRPRQLLHEVRDRKLWQVLVLYAVVSLFIVGGSTSGATGADLDGSAGEGIGRRALLGHGPARSVTCVSVRFPESQFPIGGGFDLSRDGSVFVYRGATGVSVRL